MKHDEVIQLVENMLSRMTAKQIHALLYVSINEANVREPPMLAYEQKRSLLPDLFRAQLNARDQLAELEPGHFGILLHSTTESGVLRMARLLRNSFQQSERRVSRRSASIGAVLFDRDNHSARKLLSVVYRLAVKAHEKAGNRIEFLDLQNSYVKTEK